MTIKVSAGLAISICLSILVPAKVWSSTALQHQGAKDSLQIQVESNPKKGGNTFNLLPKFDRGKDTAGFKLIPKHFDNGDVNDGEFVPYDSEPQIVKKVEPKYPELAKRSGLEGKVIVKMLVGKDGKVKQVAVLKSDAEIFNGPAIEAAKQFVFTPAYIDKKPVEVWVSYPFRFKLPDKKR